MRLVHQTCEHWLSKTNTNTSQGICSVGDCICGICCVSICFHISLPIMCEKCPECVYFWYLFKYCINLCYTDRCTNCLQKILVRKIRLSFSKRIWFQRCLPVSSSLHICHKICRHMLKTNHMHAYMCEKSALG